MRIFLINVFLLTCTSVFAQNDFRAWKPIDRKDILWQRRVTRTLDISDTANAPLGTDALSSGDSSFPNILANGIKMQLYSAYTDSNLSLAITSHQFDSCVHSAIDGLPYPKSIKGYVMVDDWMFVKNEGQMTARIVALAPYIIVDGIIKPLFWVPYPDARQHFSKFRISSPNSKQNEVTWDDYFEKRMFNGKITTVQDQSKSNGVIVPEDIKSGRREQKRRQHSGK